MCRYLLLLLFVASLLISHSYSQTTIPAGEINGTWNLAGSPYLIEGDVLIPDGQTLSKERRYIRWRLVRISNGSGTQSCRARRTQQSRRNPVP